VEQRGEGFEKKIVVWLLSFFTKFKALADPRERGRLAARARFSPLVPLYVVRAQEGWAMRGGRRTGSDSGKRIVVERLRRRGRDGRAKRLEGSRSGEPAILKAESQHFFDGTLKRQGERELTKDDSGMARSLTLQGREEVGKTSQRRRRRAHEALVRVFKPRFGEEDAGEGRETSQRSRREALH
jgi:hypothetical protein